MSERIQKVLARAGAGSRRQIEAWIREGRIAVNGAAARIGEPIGPRDRVTLDGRLLRVREPDSDTRVMLYHRSPRRTPEEGQVDEPIDLTAKLPKRAGRRWISISPLPPNDGGLEVLTSDGALAQALMRKLGTLRIEFAVRIRGEPTLGQLEYLKSGLLDDRTLDIESVVPGGGEGANRWIKLITRGARARDIHRLVAAAGLQLSRLLRVSIGPLFMDRSLGREHTEALPAGQTNELYSLAGVVRGSDLRAANEATRAPRVKARRPQRRSEQAGARKKGTGRVPEKRAARPLRAKGGKAHPTAAPRGRSTRNKGRR